MLSPTFEALNKEAQFTKEMLASGATQIRRANYASKGIYFQAFTSLSTGLERIGKLCLMLDHWLDNAEKFPDSNYMKKEICHDILSIYERSVSIVAKRNISLKFLQDLSCPIHQAILSVLSDFAQGDRYSNINLLVGAKNPGDPVACWFDRVDKPMFETHVSQRRKQTINHNAAAISTIFAPHISVLHTSERGNTVVNVEEASRMTGMYEAVAPHRQLCVVQIIRYWVELLTSLQYLAIGTGSQDVPFFSEIFGGFYNDDVYIKTRKTWDSI